MTVEGQEIRTVVVAIRDYDRGNVRFTNFIFDPRQARVFLGNFEPLGDAGIEEVRCYDTKNQHVRDFSDVRDFLGEVA